MENLGNLVLNFFIHSEALEAAQTGNVTGVIIALVYFFLLIASIVGLAVIIERLIRTRRKRYIDDGLLTGLVKNFDDDDISTAITSCEANRTVLATVMAVELAEFQMGHVAIEEAIESAGEEIEDKMHSNLDILTSVAKIGPLIGLLGTVLGMMYAFGQLDLATKKETLAHGITTALDTTVRGLIIAIFCLSFEGYFLRRIDRLSRDLNVVFSRIIRISRRKNSEEEESDENTREEEQKKTD